MRTFSIASSVTLLFLAACGSDATAPASAVAPPVTDAEKAATTTTATSTDTDTAPKKGCTASQGTAYSTYKSAFFGVLHQHTSYSIDAYGFGTRVTPAQAYEFAKGDSTITTVGGRGSTIGPMARALDFLAITDHSEWLGIDHVVTNCGKNSTSADCQALRNETKQAWTDEQTAAANANEPCKFTSLVAYEWTSMPTEADGTQYTNHRNVIFANANSVATPLDSNDYPTAQELFTGLDAQCSGTCSALVIPHNSNMSDGKSLELPDSLSPTELAAMQKYQRLVEIYQHKGSSECYAGGNDPECKFEYLNIAAGDTDKPNSYVRESLGNGIVYATTHASDNPLQLGVIAAVDDHNGAAGWIDDDAFVGHLGLTDGTPSLRLNNFPDFGPGGLAGVWAEENTRDALYAALQRRETYGTSGPRIQVRFFETASTSPCTADFPKTIVDGGAIPMGGSFSGKDVMPGGPTFAIAAWPDPANQPTVDDQARPALLAGAAVIKVHAVTTNGTTAMVEDKPSPVTIDPHGSCHVWTDLGYQAGEKAVYYVRVLQEPTYRWSHYDCRQQPNVAGCEKGGALNTPIRERAWTSPIWFNP